MNATIPEGWMVSTAHEWRQKLPLIDNVLTCIRCNHEVPIVEFGTVRCVEHYEDKKSGFIS